MILDTNGLSALADGDMAVAEILNSVSRLAIPVIVLGEYRFGIAQSRHRPKYETWLQALLTECKVLNADQQTAVEYAEVRRELKREGRPIPANDLWISAIARQHRMPLLSRDQHFDFVSGLHRVSW